LPPSPTSEFPTIASTLAEIRGVLTKAGVDSAAAEARLLLCHCLGVDPPALIAHRDRPVPAKALHCVREAARQRVAGRPIAYLLGRREFWSLPLQVDERCLIPRPETELLVARALAQRPAQGARVLDLGTGSGAVILALKRERPDIEAWGSDLSAGALAVAAGNAHALGLTIRWFQGRWLEALASLPAFDLIVSNPPYIDAADPHLQQGDLRFEPRSALIAADRGLADLASIARGAVERLRPGGALLLEHGFEQGLAVRALLVRLGFLDVASHRDLAGHERVTEGLRPGPWS
jgi:release factor glutamine methyltransferase